MSSWISVLLIKFIRSSNSSFRFMLALSKDRDRREPPPPKSVRIEFVRIAFYYIVISLERLG